jgi:HEAT repeat protein
MAHTASLLSDGRVLVAGGSGLAGSLASTELYTPAKGVWTVTDALEKARERHTAISLPNGQVLVMAGGAGRLALATAELFDPRIERWAVLISPLSTARQSHTTTLLPDGKLLVAGGFQPVNASASWLSSAELFDPVTGEWGETSGLNVSRFNHTATLLPNGSVLLAGGWSTNGVIASVELYVSTNQVSTPTKRPTAQHPQIPTYPPHQPPPASKQNPAGPLISYASNGIAALDSMYSKWAEMVRTANEPTYKGRHLSYWINDVHWESSMMPQPLKDEAKVAIAHIGTNAIPFLLKLVAEDASFSGVIQAFQILGPSARPAIPELARLATNQPASVSRATAYAQRPVTMFGYSALLALGGIGPDAVPTLLTILTNSVAPGTRMGAIKALMEMGTNALPAMPVLLQYVYDENDMVAMDAVTALGISGGDSPVALAALEDVSRGPRLILRSGAIDALRHFGPAGVPALVRALSDTNQGNAYIALHVLAFSEPSALTNAAVLALAAEGLQSADDDRRHWAARVLRATDQQSRGIKPDLMVPVGHEDQMLEEATNTLRRLAPELLGNRHHAEP